MTDSQTEFAVRSNPDELQNIVTQFSVNQHQIWFDMAVPMVFPVACQCVITVPLGKRQIICQCRDDDSEVDLQRLPVQAHCLAL